MQREDVFVSADSPYHFHFTGPVSLPVHGDISSLLALVHGDKVHGEREYLMVGETRCMLVKMLLQRHSHAPWSAHRVQRALVQE